MSKTLARPVQVFHPEHGHVQLQPGKPVPDWAEDMITNPKVYEEVAPDEIEAPTDRRFERDFGVGPFERRTRDQLVALALNFGIEVDGSKGGDTKAEIIKRLEAEGIEPSTVPDED